MMAGFLQDLDFQLSQTTLLSVRINTCLLDQELPQVCTATMMANSSLKLISKA